MTRTFVEPDCRFGDGQPAVVRVALSAGCICYPGDREQDLCLYHWMRSTPIGRLDLVKMLAWRQGVTIADAVLPEVLDG